MNRFHDKFLELQVLGGMAADIECLNYGAAHLTESDFHDLNNKKAYNIITKNSDNPKIIIGELIREIGGEKTNAIISEFPPDIADSCKKLRGYYLYRERYKIAQRVLNIEFKDVHSDYLKQLGQAYNDLENFEISSDPTLDDYAEKAYEKISGLYDAHKTGVKPKGFPLFLPRLRETLHMAYGGEYWIIAGRPGHGKSTFALNMAVYGAEQGERPLVVTLEMPPEDYLLRAACRHTRINSGVTRTGNMPQESFLKICDYLSSVKKSGIEFINVESATIDNLIRRIKSKVSEHRSTAVFIDQINNLDYGNKKFYEAVTIASTKIRAMAKNLNVPVFVVCQLNREVEKRNTSDKMVKDPRLSDLRESGALEQDAMTVILLNWPHRVDTTKPLNEYVVKIGKSRYGDIGYLKDVKIYPEILLIRQETANERGPYHEL